MSASGKPKVLLLGAIEFDGAHSAWSSLCEVAHVIDTAATDRAGFLAECAADRYDGVVAIYRTFDSFKLTGRFDDELLSALPTSLKFIAHNGAGYDQIDIKGCMAHGIRVSNTPTAVDDSTSDITMFLLLGALRNLNVTLMSARRGQWRGEPLPALGHDPQGKVLGILGMGGIGREVAKKARAFGMKIRYHNRSRLDPGLEDGAEYVSFETLLAESDVLSLNLPLNPTTRHLISHAQFDKMKQGIIIINTARGAVVDEAALVAALQSGRVATAGLDVFENEPEIHPGLLADPRVLLVPHMGTYTVETLIKMEDWAISNVYMAVTEGRLKSIVPEQREWEQSLGKS